MRHGKYGNLVMASYVSPKVFVRASYVSPKGNNVKIKRFKKFL